MTDLRLLYVVGCPPAVSIGSLLDTLGEIGNDSDNDDAQSVKSGK